MNLLLGPLRQAAIVNGLRHCLPFAGCPPAILAEMSTITAVKTLDAGSVLFDEQTAVTSFYVVQQGAVKLHRVTSLGTHIVHVFRPHELMGEETVASSSGYAATAQATEPSQVLVVGRAGFLALLKKYPELSLSLLQALSAQVEVLVGRLDELTLKDVPTRVADWLLHHCPDPDSRQPQTVHVPESKRLLAMELGTSSETLSRTLAKFRHQQLVHVNGRDVTVLCPARLAQSIHDPVGCAERALTEMPRTSSTSPRHARTHPGFPRCPSGGKRWSS